MSSCGSTSGRVEAICPSFMNEGPRSSSTSPHALGPSYRPPLVVGLDEGRLGQKGAEAHAPQHLAEPVFDQDE